MPKWLAIKDLQYFNGPAWQAKALTQQAGPFEAQDPDQALERALEIMAQTNAFLACLPGRIQLYRLDPSGGPIIIGADLGRGRREVEHG